jgi:uncharacterized membrane protein YhaH (DUF805 family)
MRWGKEVILWKWFLEVAMELRRRDFYAFIEGGLIINVLLGLFNQLAKMQLSTNSQLLNSLHLLFFVGGLYHNYDKL